MKRQLLALLLALLMAVALVACGDEPSAPASSAADSSVSSSSSEPKEESVPDASEPKAEESATDTSEPVEADDPLTHIGLSADELRQVYDELDALLNSEDSPAFAAEYDAEAIDAYETDCTKQVADAHGISTDDVDEIYIQGVMGYFTSAKSDEYSILHGELVDTNVTGTTLVIKAKIQPSMTNKMTVDQNYYNVCDIIRNQCGEQYDEIQYWAVADMADGSEGKVISFTVPKSVISTIATQQFADNQLGDYVTDLWILPSLK